MKTKVKSIKKSRSRKIIERTKSKKDVKKKYIIPEHNHDSHNLKLKLEEINKDLGFADKLMNQGVKSDGREFLDAIELYNYAIEEAYGIKNKVLVKNIINHSQNMFELANKDLKEEEKEEKVSGEFNGASPRIKIQKLDEARVLLINPIYNKIKKNLQKITSIIFFFSAIVFLIGPLIPNITGAVIGDGEENILGLMGFVMLLIGVYLFYKKR